MNVHILSEHNKGDRKIIGVFSSLSDALQIKSDLVRDLNGESFYEFHYSIHTHKVNDFNNSRG